MDSTFEHMILYNIQGTKIYSTPLYILHFVFQGFNWTRFIQGVLSSVSVEVLQDEEVVVYSSPYLEKMNEVLPKHSVRSAQESN